MKKAERIGWIDTLRAFAVFAIVLGHTLRNATVVYPWLYSSCAALRVNIRNCVPCWTERVQRFFEGENSDPHDSILLLCNC